MKMMTSSYEWLREVFPEGIKFPSSTVLTGPMGAGKPILAGAFLTDWLRNGGSVLSIPLQFPDSAFTKQNLNSLYGFDLEQFSDQVVFVSFNPEIDSIRKRDGKYLEANMMLPGNWYEVLSRAKDLLPDTQEILVFVTAINLPLVSDEYYEQLIDMFGKLFKEPSGYSYLFAISTSMVEDRVSKVSEGADHLIEAYITKEHALRFRVLRAKETRFIDKEQQVPFGKEVLEKAEQRAKRFRVAPVQKIKNYKKE